MKICTACNNAFSGDNWVCPSCGKEPEMRQGLYVFAPQMAESNEHYDPGFFNELAQLEERNFWFRARNRLILSAFARYFPAARNGLEIGCGTGYVLSALGRSFPGVKFTGSEIYIEGLSYASRRVLRTNLLQMDAQALPYRDEFDVIGCFDVLEHIEDDRKVLSEIFRALKSKGGLILTVPQHMFLWSDGDAQSRHVRRYGREELERKLVSTGFKVVRATSFVAFLLPVMFLTRFTRTLRKTGASGVLDELRIGRFLNRALEFVMYLERIFITAGISFRWGGSLMMVAYKD